ncbi:hypothetical protein J6590_083959 [Homalodisca vitripennis]|nr:hypothetical protein J6590_083959 [Homalodisca vitripennis]
MSFTSTLQVESLDQAYHTRGRRDQTEFQTAPYTCGSNEGADLLPNLGANYPLTLTNTDNIGELRRTYKQSGCSMEHQGTL